MYSLVHLAWLVSSGEKEELALLGFVGRLEFSIVEELRSSACAPARVEAESRPGPGCRAELRAVSSGRAGVAIVVQWVNPGQALRTDEFYSETAGITAKGRTP